jgi:uncharacterized protein
MKRRPFSMFSDGLRLDGELHIPDGLLPSQRQPAVITCSGYQGLKSIHPARFARALVPDGYVCLAFDYRGFGRSAGERGRLVPQEQVEDVRAAISCLELVPEVDPAAISLIGWALGGGVAIAAAADDPRVRSVVAINAIGDGERSVRFMHDNTSWQALMTRLASDRKHRAAHGRSQAVPPFDVVRLDTVTEQYVDAELYREDGFGHDVSLASVDYLLRFRPSSVVHRIAPRPLLLIHGDANALHSPAESDDLYLHAQDPKRLVTLEGAGHTEWAYDEHPTFQQVVRIIRGFLAESRRKPSATHDKP